MYHKEFEPLEQLKDFIKCFWYDSRDFGMSETNFEVVPDGFAEIIFHFGKGCGILQQGISTPMPSPFLIGLLNQPVVFQSSGRLEIIGIRCFPWTVFDLLGLPSGKDGVRTFEHLLARLHNSLDALVKADKIDEAISEVQQYFVNVAPYPAADSLLFKAGAAMRGANGTLSVSKVAEAAYATVRTLERNFKQSSGYTVKDVSNLIRFEQVRNNLLLNPNINLAGLAHELGYADQAHLTKEFKRYSGKTPASFAREAKKEDKY